MKKKIIAMLLSVSIILNIGSVMASETDTSDIVSSYLKAFAVYINKNYVGDISMFELYENALNKIVGGDVELMKEAMQAMVGALDEYSYILTDEDYAAYVESLTGDKGVIGIVVQKSENGIEIIEVTPGMSAHREGLRAGDIIVAVNGESVEDKSLDYAVSKITGEVGTTVKVKVKRDGIVKEYTFLREYYEVSPVSYTLADEDIMYISIDKFNAHTNQFLEQALDEARIRGVKKIILDLRNNGGGSFDEAIKVASHFVPNKGKIVSISYKDSENNEDYFSTLETKYFDLALLINEYSASSSEIVAGAIKDNKAGKVIGVNSYGKGTVQMFQSLNFIDGGAGITIANYLTPNGISIEKVGVEPDIYIENSEEKLDTSKFKALTYADKPTVGTKNENVTAIEERLNAMGYNTGEVDDTFTEQTKSAVMAFQRDNGLYAYGVADITTQISLNNVANEFTYFVDRQFIEAFNYLKGINN